MNYLAGLLSGVSGSALFWLIDKYLLTLGETRNRIGMAVCFLLVGAGGLMLTRKAPGEGLKHPKTSIAEGISGANIKVELDGVKTSGGGQQSFVKDIKATGDVDVNVKNIQQKS